MERSTNYPTLAEYRPEVEIDSDGVLKQCFIIVNKGKITAHNVRIIVQYFIKGMDNKLHIFETDGAFYIEKDDKNEYKITVFDYEIDLPSDTKRVLCTGNKNKSSEMINNLINAIVIIRYLVPFDTNYRYKEFGYIKNDLPASEHVPYMWQLLSSHHNEKLVNAYFELIKQGEGTMSADEYNDFFIDHNLYRLTQ